MKKMLALALLLPLISTAQIGGLLNKAKNTVTTKSGSGSIGNTDIASALKEALDKGIDKQVTKLTAVDGFYKNPSVKILFPPELQKVDKALRSVGLGNLADQGIQSLNRAAEDAVKESTPIFVGAVKQMTFTDAKNILMGSDNAATSYLQKTTTKPLYDKFNPKVQESIGKVGADKIWAAIISKYNSLPLVSKVNPDINDYVTNRALEGVYKMIAVEEKDIRNNLNSRTSDLLKKVFALQDRK